MKLLIHSQKSTVAPWKGTETQFYPTLYNGCDFLSIVWLNLIHISKKGQGRGKYELCFTLMVNMSMFIFTSYNYMLCDKISISIDDMVGTSSP